MRSAAVAALLIASACDARPVLYTETRAVFGPVEAQVKVCARGRGRSERAAAAAFAAMSHANNLLGSYVARSEISRLNRSGGQPCHLSAETASVLRRSLEISELTGGAFDVTAGPLITLWKKAIDSGALPDEEKLARARERSGFEHLEVRDNSATFRRDGMRVDLGGIAKGWAVDRAVAALKREGVENALVDAGGDGYALGRAPDGGPWRIGLQDPDTADTRQLPGATLHLSGRAYATSGDYRQYTEIEGVRYSHIVDPRTGRPARKAASATVIADDCATADALATALCVLGPKQGVELINRMEGVECLIITRGRDGLVFHASDGFPVGPPQKGGAARRQR